MSIKLTAVTNLYSGSPFPFYDVNIMRPSIWGNPFMVNRDGSRAQVITRYALWIAEQPHLLAKLPELKGKILGCCCKPLACHGDVLARMANELP